MIAPFIVDFTPEEIDSATAAVADILRSGELILGPHTDAFESATASMAGTAHAIAVNSGSTALEIIFRALEVRDRVVLVPTNTNFATAAAALYAGARVELYDSGLYPHVDDLAGRLTPEIAAVVVVHIGGYLSPDLPHIAAMCRDHGVPLVEDAAHAHGSHRYGQAAGGFGDAAAFSFYPTKVITTGEGGMITTNRERLAQVACRYRDQGKTADGRMHILMGNSWRMTEIGAALGTIQLARLDHDLNRRRQVIDRYETELSGTGLRFPQTSPDSQVSGHKCVAILDEHIDRDSLRTAMRTAGVQLGRGVYEIPLHQQPVLAGSNTTDPFPRADDFANRHICLPLWRTMTGMQVEQVIAACLNALG